MAEVGAAITRGVSLLQTPAAAPHAALPVPSTAPQTPETASLPSPVPLLHEMQPTLASQAVEVGKEVLVITICATAGAIGGASAGENIGGDMALSSLGPLAVPLGQAARRSIGRIVGGAAGAAAIRCPSRIRSSRSPSTSVRFAPQPIISRSSEFALAQSSVTSPPSQSGENCQLPTHTATNITNDLIVTLRQEQKADATATQNLVSSLTGTITQSEQV